MKSETVLPSYQCAECKSILILHEKHQIIKCHFCGVSYATIVTCEKDHFVCPWCDEKHGVKPEDITNETHEKELEEAHELDDDGDYRYGAIQILIMSCISPDRAEELGELYDRDHDFEDEEI